MSSYEQLPESVQRAWERETLRGVISEVIMGKYLSGDITHEEAHKEIDKIYNDGLPKEISGIMPYRKA